MTTHKIKKGFDLPLAGRPQPVLADAAEPSHVALETFEFAGIKPKVLVKEGDPVETGQPVYLDKVDRDIVWCAPASGTIESVEFGPRRFLTRVVIKVGAETHHAELPALPPRARQRRTAPPFCKRRRKSGYAPRRRSARRR